MVKKWFTRFLLLLAAALMLGLLPTLGSHWVRESALFAPVEVDSMETTPVETPMEAEPTGPSLPELSESLLNRQNRRNHPNCLRKRRCWRR